MQSHLGAFLGLINLATLAAAVPKRLKLLDSYFYFTIYFFILVYFPSRYVRHETLTPCSAVSCT